MHRGLKWVGLVGLVCGACGDDGSASSDGASSSTGVTTGSGGPADGTSTGGVGTDGTATGTGDSTSPTTSTATEGSSGTAATDGTTGATNLPPEPQADLYFVRQDLAPLVVDAATGVLANDLEPEGETLAVDTFDATSTQGGTVAMQPDGSFDYTPPAGFVGEDAFSYTAVDEAAGTASATVTVSVGRVAVDVAALANGFVIDGATAGDESGHVVAGGGDVDGDGLDDVVVTSMVAGGGAGRVWVVFGKADGTPVDLNDVTAGNGGFVITGETAGDDMGTAAAIVDDVDGDGLDDVLVGAPLASTAGRAYLVRGKADGTSVALADVVLGSGGFVLEGEGFGEDAGASVAAAGDVDGDGLGDLLVGAPQGGPIPGGGRGYVVFGKPDTMPVVLADVYNGVGGFTLRGAGFDDNAGDVVAGAGDVDGDGLDDVIVGARLANAGGLGNSGRCYVVFGRTSTAVIDAGALGAGGFYIDGAASLVEACAAAAGPGDIDGDGRADIVVGEPFGSGPLTLQGRAYAVFGKASTTTVSLVDVANGMGGFAIEGEAVGDLVGQAVAGLDLTGDGRADLVTGTANVDIPGTFAGRGYVTFAKSDGATVALADLTTRLGGYRVPAEATNDRLGSSVTAAGDVDGDGFGDFVISAPRYDGPAGVDAGRSYVVFGGNDRGALTRLGTAADDVIAGDGAPDVIVAGAGNDEVHSGGGPDVIYGGAGDDVIGVSGGSFFRLDGGSGFDTLAIDDGGITLNLTLVPGLAVVDFEQVDLTGTGDNALQIDLRHLRSSTGTTRTLRIIGDAGDTLDADLGGGGFADLGIAAGVHTWSNGIHTLEVVDPVVANVTP